MNKFPDPRDGCYNHVCLKIEEFLSIIRQPSSILRRADAEIRGSYQDNIGRLQISRLSGDQVPMEQCYINLHIIRHADREPCSDRAQQTPLDQRQRQVKASQEGTRVELQDLFNPQRNRDNEEPLNPRRIYIHGRPGVGKTTLCKKVVYDFLYKAMWKELFDRILWVPLRNITSHDNEYELAKLFRDVFFSQCVEEAKTVLRRC